MDYLTVFMNYDACPYMIGGTTGVAASLLHEGASTVHSLLSIYVFDKQEIQVLYI